MLREIDFLSKICWSIPCLHPSWKVHTWKWRCCDEIASSSKLVGIPHHLNDGNLDTVCFILFFLLHIVAKLLISFAEANIPGQGFWGVVMRGQRKCSLVVIPKYYIQDSQRQSLRSTQMWVNFWEWLILLVELRRSFRKSPQLQSAFHKSFHKRVETWYPFYTSCTVNENSWCPKQSLTSAQS